MRLRFEALALPALLGVAQGTAPAVGAQALAAGTSLTVRTLDTIAAEPAMRGRPVRVMVLAPVWQDARIAIAPRTIIEGIIEDAGIDADAGARHFVHVRFTALRPDSGTAEPIAGLVLFGAIRAEFRERNRRIEFAPGTDLTVRLASDVALPAWPVYALPLPVGTDSTLTQLLDTLPRRAMAADGRVPGDFFNLAFIGDDSTIRHAFVQAGWDLPNRMSAASAFETFVRTTEGEGFAHQPVSRQVAFGRPPDLVFQRVTDTFGKRRHIRLWRTTLDYDGAPVWTAAATHDVGIEFSATLRNFTHRTDPAIDGERDTVVAHLVAALQVARLSMVPRNAPTAGRTESVRSDWRVAMIRLVSLASAP